MIAIFNKNTSEIYLISFEFTKENCNAYDYNYDDYAIIDNYDYNKIYKYDIDTNKVIEDIEKINLNILSKLIDLVVLKKKNIAYGGYTFKKDDISYICSTSENDIGKVSLKLQSIQDEESDYILTWKVTDTDKNIKYLTLTKAEFIALVNESQNFVDEQFTKEAIFLAELATKTEFTDEFVADFKIRVEEWS